MTYYVRGATEDEGVEVSNAAELDCLRAMANPGSGLDEPPPAT